MDRLTANFTDRCSRTRGCGWNSRHGGDVILKSQAHVVGDIHHQSLAIESGAFFDGRSMQIRRNGQATEKLEAKSLKQIANPRENLSRRIERAESVDAD